MGKYNITYKCGHEDRVELFGSMKSRDYRLEQMSQSLCPECQRKEKMRLCGEMEEELSLPELKGSEKQIAWARSLRKDALDKLRNSLRDVDKKMQRNDDEELKTLKEYIEITIKYMSEQTESKFFIDNRYDLKTIGLDFGFTLTERNFSSYVRKYKLYKYQYEDMQK